MIPQRTERNVTGHFLFYLEPEFDNFKEPNNEARSDRIGLCREGFHKLKFSLQIPLFVTFYVTFIETDHLYIRRLLFLQTQSLEESGGL